MTNFDHKILDYEAEELNRKTFRAVFFLVVAVNTYIIWSLIYYAPSLPYDENYGNLFISFLLSMLELLVFIILFFWKRYLIKANFISVLLYLIFSSPISIWFILSNFEFIFGYPLEFSVG